ncbi:MAG: hypothetical protein J4452_00045 [Candidatus Aenigmarchaeota archaeon]|nr:hypothetical protein [Candidatus Aenigmarchaeota archaeon]
MKTAIITGIIFFLLSVSVVSACSNPILRRENGGAINPFGGTLQINGSQYSGMTVNYNLQVENRNDQGMTVSLVEGNDLKDYVNFESVYVPANSIVTMPNQIWIGGQSVFDKVNVLFTCDDGGPQFLTPFFYTIIYGKHLEPPPASSCESSNLNGCYEGILRTYFCQDNQLTYRPSCTTYCCESYGGEGSFCSADRQSCISFNNLPVGTEGNIALLCGKKDCNDGIERDIRFLLRYLGWNVTQKIYDSWTEEELNNYDIILCTDQSKGCKINFNSPVYNSHINGKPFLEIPDSKSSKAAYDIGYLTKKGNTKGKGFLNIPSFDFITQGLNNPFNAVGNIYVATVETDLFKDGVKDIADSSVGSSIFKAKEDYGHGRYAYAGLFYDAGISDLTADGQVVLNRTLKWLKCGDECFGGSNFNEPIKGKIAFLCADDDCDNDKDMEMIIFLRNNGYEVEGKDTESWTVSELLDYDLMACSHGSQGCKISTFSAAYIAHRLNGKGFLEIPDSSRVNAAFIFGYISKSLGTRKSTSFISENLDNKIFDGFTSPLNVSIKKRSLNGVKIENLLSITDKARILTSLRGTNTIQNVSTTFTSDISLTKGRYAYIGWIPSLDYLTEDGKQLLLRTVQWVKCGDSCL